MKDNRKIIGRRASIWTVKKGKTIILFDGKCATAFDRFRIHTKGIADPLLGDKIGLTFYRDWSDGTSDYINADIRYRGTYAKS